MQKMLRRDKQAELELLCDELEDNAKKGNSRLVFQTVKKLTKPFSAANCSDQQQYGQETH